MRYIVLLILTLSTLSIGAQTRSVSSEGNIQGAVFGDISNEPIAMANIRLLQQSDSSYVKGTETDEHGNFKLKAPHGNYLLEISYVGYLKYTKAVSLNKKTPNLNMGKLEIMENQHMLAEMVIEAKVPDIVVKGDTIEYTASSYTRDQNSMLADMVRNIPGIEIDKDNNITANGKPVKKILVDGKEFFGNDMAMALTNLPANMISKLQIFKEESEKAKLTGFKDKDPEQVLNLVVKEELKRSAFGDVRAGYGNKDKYNTRAMINYMADGDQASLIGNLNNVNVSDYASYSVGEDKNKNIGLNVYKQTSEKLRIGGNIRYSENDNLTVTDSNIETFLSSGNRYSKSKSNNESKRDNIGAAFNINWELDSLTTITAYSHMYSDRSRNSMETNSSSYVSAGDTTWGNSFNNTQGESYNINNTLMIGRKLNSKGRNISLQVNHAYRSDDRNGKNYSSTRYSDGTATKIIDQRTQSDMLGNDFSVSATYVEPLGSDHSLQVGYTYAKSYSKRLQDARKQDATGDYTELDRDYSRDTRSDYINQTINIDVQGHKEKYNYTAGINFEPSRSTSLISLGDSIIEDLKQNVFNFSPNLFFSYTPNMSTNIDFSYYGRSSQPGVRQLSADTTHVNATTKYYGNPNLKPSYDNSLNLSYMKSDYETSKFLTLGISFGYTMNDIVNYTDIDSRGNSISTYRNVSGKINAGLNGAYNTPLKNKRFTVNTSTNVNFYKNIGFTNGEKAITKNLSISELASLRYKVEKVESELKAGINYSMAKNNLTSIDNQSTTNFTLSNYTQVHLPLDFSISSNINYTKYNGYGDDFQSSELLWNMAIDKQFLKNKKGTLKLQFFDILKDRSNVTRQVNSNFISDYRTNTISRYALLTFSYKFSMLKGASKQ